MVRIKTVINSLAYCIALLGFIPLFPYLGTIPRVIFPVALAAGIVADRNGRPVNGRLPTVISVLFFLFYATQSARDNLVVPAVNLLIILLAVRLFSEKGGRNYLQMYALSLFALAGSSLFSLGGLFLCYFLLMLTLIAVSLVILTFYAASSSEEIPLSGMRRIGTVALGMPVASLPLVLVFFFVLPRTQYPLWHFLNMGGARVAGFSERVEPGTAPAVGEVRNVAFRAKCEKLPLNLLYWRGTVLNSFEGKAWVRRAPPAEQGVAGKGSIVLQTIFPEPGHASQLMALNIPRSISGVDSVAASDYTFLRKGAPETHLKYEAVSGLSDTITARGEVDGNFYRRLPADLSPRLVARGKGIAVRGKDDAGKLALLEEFFHAQKLTYATSGLPIGGDSLDKFLFDAKRGHCEFFASSCAVLLRIAGVPTRLVGGYYGGDYNDIGGYYVITEDMAHVWVEVYLAGRGWVTVDPTRWAVNYSVIGAARQWGGARTISMVFDTLGYYWNLAVINYDLEHQLRLITNANGRLQRLAVPVHVKWPLVVALIAAVVGAGVLGLARGRVSREERILGQFFKRVHREYGVTVGSATGLHELAATLDDPCADRFAEIYGGSVYRDRALTPEESRRLKDLIGGVHNRQRGRFRGRPDRFSCSMI